MKEIFSAIFCIFCIFILILITNALRARLKAPKLSCRLQHYSPEEQKAYALKLGEIIRCRTISDSSDFPSEEFDKLRKTFEELFPIIHKSAERLTFGKDCWVYKIKGKNESRNIMLMSHHDVVSAKGQWLHPPFCGEIFDDCLWGRGSLDTKTPLFAEFQALEELLSQGFEPECNIFIASSHNEEIGGNGIPLAVEYFKEKKIFFETVLDEGGAIIPAPIAGIKPGCAMIAVHEKGRYSLNCIAKDTASHKGLVANADTPEARISAFITEIRRKNIFIKRLHPSVKEMFSHLSPYTPFGFSLIFSNLFIFGGLLKTLMPKLNAQAGAMVSTTVTFNEINSDKQEKSCTARAFFRPIDKADFSRELEKIKKIAEKYSITLEPAPDNAIFTPADMSLYPFSYVKDCIRKIFPDVIPAPYILPAGTDARHLCEICPSVIRFAPIEMNNEQFASVHSENEYVSLEGIGNCVAFYKEFIKNYK